MGFIVISMEKIRVLKSNLSESKDSPNLFATVGFTAYQPLLDNLMLNKFIWWYKSVSNNYNFR